MKNYLFIYLKNIKKKEEKLFYFIIFKRETSKYKFELLFVTIFIVFFSF
jgi:hypothetical protein